MIETAHPRTQLAWARTALAVVAVGLIEVRLLIGPDPGTALWMLGAALAAVVVIGGLAAQRLRRNTGAMALEPTSSGGRAPTALTALTLLVCVMAMVSVLTQESLV